MSLYGGIKFAVGPVENAEAGPSRSSSTPGAEDSPGPSFKGTNPSAPLSSSGTEKIKVARPSAALSFAPRINKPKPVAKPSVPATTYSAPPVSTSTQPAPFSRPDKDDTQYGKDGKALARAPAMTLQAKLVEPRREGNDVSKKRKKKKKKIVRVLPTFDPEEQYDPYRPNDLGEYQEYRKRLKEERRAKYIESRRRKMNGEDSESSEYSNSEEEAPRRDAPKMFAPPRMYSPPSSGSASTLYPPPASVSAAATGDEAYARRLALSQAATGDDAYARRAALSQAGPVGNTPAPPSFTPGFNAGAPPIPPPPVSEPPLPPPPSPPRAPTVPSPTNFAPPSTTVLDNAPGFTRTPPPRPFVPPPANLVAAAPGIAGPPMPPFAPSLLPQPVTALPIPAQPNAEQTEFDRQLEEKRKALAAIAAKFATLPGAKAPAEPFEEIEGESFAEKMMRKWGHKEGQGLGSKGEGITEALSVEHVEAPPKNPAGMSKRQLAKKKAAAANAKNRKWVQHTKAQGKIVNAQEEVRQKGELEKYGEPSRVMCLRGIVDDVDDIDVDLADEIGEECSKHGIVERVVLHMVEPPPVEPEECLRVFVVFSGMAGAWRNLRELDGRFFGGKKIRATYFDETKFDSGDRDGPIL